MDFHGDTTAKRRQPMTILPRSWQAPGWPSVPSPISLPLESFQTGCWDQSGLLRSALQRGCKSKSGSTFIHLWRPLGSLSFKFLPTHDVLNFEVSLAIDVNCLATFCEDATTKANRLGTNFPWHSSYIHTLVVVPELCILLMYYMKHILILRAMFWAMCIIAL